MREYSEILTVGNLAIFHLKRIWKKRKKRWAAKSSPTWSRTKASSTAWFSTASA